MTRLAIICNTIIISQLYYVSALSIRAMPIDRVNVTGKIRCTIIPRPACKLVSLSCCLLMVDYLFN